MVRFPMTVPSSAPRAYIDSPSIPTFVICDIIFPMDYKKFITIEPGKRSGKPCIRGTRMTVTDVLEYLAGGMTQDDILKDFPDLTPDDIRACLAYAADRERKLAAIPE